MKSKSGVANKAAGPKALAGTRRKPASASTSPFQTGEPTHEELLHFFNESPDLLCIADFDGKLTKLNPAWLPVLRWTPEELKARPFLDFVHPDDRAATLAQMARLAGGGVS